MSQPHHLFNLFASITNLCLISLQTYFFGILQGQEFVLSCLCDVEQNKLHINPFPNKPLFLRVCSTSLLKTLYTRTEQFLLFPQWGKGEIARYEEFLFSSPPPPPPPPVFSTCLENFLPLSSCSKLSSANSLSLEESQCVVWERVNSAFTSVSNL